MGKEKIRFFSDEKSTINKGYYNQKKIDNIKSQFKNQHILSFLPDIEILSEYEEMYPGSTQSLFNIAKKEQENQFNIEREKIKHHSRVKIFRYILSFLSCCVVCFTTLFILVSNPVFGMGFALSMLVFILLFASIIAIYKLCSRSTKKYKSDLENTKHYSKKKPYLSRKSAK